MEKLLSDFGRRGVNLGLLTKKVDIEDLDHTSKYFGISEISSVFTAGKNPVAFNGSSFLKEGSELLVECLDSNGNSLYIEQSKSKKSQFSDVSKFVISIHIYDEAYNGAGKLIFVGTTKKGEVVRWVGNITIDKTLANSSPARFYNKPSLEVRTLLYPVVDTSLANVDFPPNPYPRVAAGTATIQSTVSFIQVTNGGQDYISSPTVYINGGYGENGASAIASANVSSGKVVSITITYQGAGYETAPTIVISGGGGTGATAVAQLTSIITNITLDDGGYGYLETPTITISGIGSGATATCTILDQSVNSITLVDGGSGYIVPPKVNFSFPPSYVAPVLNQPITFVGDFYSLAATPNKDINRLKLDKKRTNPEYQLILKNVPLEDLVPTRFPENVFNSQMEGRPITLNIRRIYKPFSYEEIDTNITASYTIKKVINNQTLLLDDVFSYAVNQDDIICNISDGTCEVSYNFIQYNTRPDSALKITPSPDSEPMEVKESYAEITYRNLKTFSGFVSRHKLYRRSLFYPGDFQLISNELLEPIELLSDTVTFNQAYDKMGTFYHAAHVSKYWFTSSANVILNAQAYPILNSMTIGSSDMSVMNGNEYVMVKNDSIGITNDNVYYPYNPDEFNALSGQSYNSNFISLKKDTLYVLSTNLELEKNELDADAKISFYFTSSIFDIRKETKYNTQYGLKLGEILVTEQVSVKRFKDKQLLFFTPIADYFGTLVLVPYHCNVTLSDVSLKVYGDYGFSPDVLFVRVPFNVNIDKEAFELKAELFDINSNLIYSDLKNTHTFEVGEFNVSPDSAQINTIVSSVGVDSSDPSNISLSTHTDEVILSGEVFLPDLPACSEDGNHRLLGWHLPSSGPDSGKVCFTNISRLFIDGNDYISLTTTDGVTSETAKSLAIRYDIVNNQGRKIYVDPSGVKYYWP